MSFEKDDRLETGVSESLLAEDKYKATENEYPELEIHADSPGKFYNVKIEISNQ